MADVPAHRIGTPPPAPVAIVTAAGGGAGRVITSRLVQAGWDVLATDIDGGGLAVLADAHPQTTTMQGDAGDEALVAQAIERVKARYGRLDLLVNNVGIAGPTAAAEAISLAEWEATLRANLTAHFLWARDAIPLLRTSRGCIVNISSASAKVGLPLRLPYVVSKAAVLSLTTSLARELGPDGIRVNAILPGAIEGERLCRVIATKAAALGVSAEAYERDLLRYISLRSTVSADDIAEAILFLAGPGGRKITGQCIGVDGNLEYEA